MSRDAWFDTQPTADPQGGHTAARMSEVSELLPGEKFRDSIQLNEMPGTSLDSNQGDFLLTLIIELAREAAKRDHEATEYTQRTLP